MPQKKKFYLKTSIAVASVLTFTLAFLLLLQTQVSRAATYDVSEGSSIQQAIDGASAGDTIRVASGTFTENLVISKSLTLLGGYTSFSGGGTRVPRSTIISGTTTPQHGIRITGSSLHVTIDGFDITHWTCEDDTTPYPSQGAGMHIAVDASSMITVHDNAIHNNTTKDTSFGGGIYADIGDTSTLYVISNTLASNDADNNGQGGGAYLTLDPGAQLHVLSNTITSNWADDYGGGLYVVLNNATFEFYSNTLEYNEADDADGGGLYVNLDANATVQAYYNKVFSNTAYANGAGMYAMLNANSYMEIFSNTISQNQTELYDGGGIFGNLDNGAYLHIEDNLMTSNFGDDNGGAIYATSDHQAQLSIFNNRIHHNRTDQYDGGGIYVSLDNQSLADLSNNTIFSNTATRSGGAVYGELKYQSHLTITTSSVTQNTATSGGGGAIRIDATNDASAYIYDTDVLTNTGEDEGGGIWTELSNGAELYIDEVRLNNNESTNHHGGGMYANLNEASQLSIVHTSIDHNRSHLYGGGVYAAGTAASEINIDNSHLNVNTARQGGSIYAEASDRSDLQFTYNAAMTNTAEDYGGIYANVSMSSTLMVNHNDVVSNTASDDYGGAYLFADNFSQFTIEDNVFMRNTTPITDNRDYGGLYFEATAYTHGTFDRNQTLDNHGGDNHGGAYVEITENSSTSLYDNVFQNNTAAKDYGGLHLYLSHNSHATGNTLKLDNNTAGEDYGGGAIELTYSSSLTLTDGITATNNQAAVDYGGLYLAGKHATHASIPHSYVANNQALDGESGGIYLGTDAENDVIIASNTHVLSNTAATDGGGLWATLDNQGKINLSGSYIAYNAVVTGTGGGMYVSYLNRGAKLILDHSDFLTNTSVNGGGGLYLYSTMSNNPYLGLRSAHFINNVAQSGHGGGLYVPRQESQVTIQAEYTLFERNSAGGSGGGAYFDRALYDTEVNFDHSTFLENTSGSHGGALYLREYVGSDLSIQGSNFKQNQAQGDGGAIFFATANNGSNIHINDNEFAQNIAHNSGGAMYTSGYLATNSSTVSLEKNDILSNTAETGSGGGVYFTNLASQNSRITFNENTLSHNQAGITTSLSTIGGGGAVFNRIIASRVDISNNVIVDNKTTQEGAGIYFDEIEDAAKVTLQGNSITGNVIYSDTLKNGGGVYFNRIKYGTMITFAQNVITGNLATGNGGGMFVAVGFTNGAFARFQDNYISDNIAHQHGGGLYLNDVYEAGQVEFIQNQFNHNTATRDYGGLYMQVGQSGTGKGNRLRFWNNDVMGNRAGISQTQVISGGHGGGLYLGTIEGSVADVRNNTILSNTAYVGSDGGNYGGLYAYVDAGSSLTLQDNHIAHNVAENSYGGSSLELDDSSRLILTHNVITGNYATLNSGGLHILNIDGENQYSLRRNQIINNAASEGAGLSIIRDDTNDALWGSSVNNVIAGNQGSGVHIENLTFNSINDTIADNTYALAISGTATSTLYLKNDILWGNGDHLKTTSAMSPSLVVANYCDVQGGIPSEWSSGTGNMNADPQFQNAPGRDYHVLSGSPVIDQGTNTGAPATDLEGVPRPVNGTVDMGAYEYYVAGVLVGQGDTQHGDPGVTVYHTLRITNTGTLKETFNLTLSGNAWTSTVVMSNSTMSLNSIVVEPGETITVRVAVEIPRNAPAHEVDTATFAATSRYNASTVGWAPLTSQANLAGPILFAPNNASTANVSTIQRHQHLLHNQRNGQDIFHLTALSSLGWHVVITPSTLTLDANESRLISVDIYVPPNADGQTDVTTVTAQSIVDSSAIDTATDETYAVNFANLSLEPDRAMSVNGVNIDVPYTHTLTNIGSYTDTVYLSTSSTKNWPVQLTPLTVTLEPGASTTVYLTVTVPTTISNGDIELRTLTATSQNNTNIKATVNDLTTAYKPSELSLTSNAPTTVTLGQQATYTHTLSNHGTLTESIVISATSSLGWPVAFTPAHIELPPEAETHIVATVSVPTWAEHLDVDQSTVIAASDTTANYAMAVNETTAHRPSHLSLSAGYATTALPGTTQLYTHTLTNNATFTENATLTVTSSQGWNVSVTPTRVTGLAPSASVLVSVSVNVPETSPMGETDTTRLIAASEQEFTQAIVDDITTVQRPTGLAITSNFPSTALVGEEKVYVHTLTNNDTLADEVILNVVSNSGWPVSIEPSFIHNLAPGASVALTVTLTLPNTGLNGWQDVTTIRAFSKNQGDMLAAVAVDLTTLLNPASIHLSAGYALAASAGSMVTYTHTLTNAGAYADTFTLQATAPEGWTATADPSEVTLQVGSSALINMQVYVPSGTMAGYYTSTLTAISALGEAAQTSAFDVTVLTSNYVYLPFVMRN